MSRFSEFEQRMYKFYTRSRAVLKQIELFFEKIGTIFEKIIWFPFFYDRLWQLTLVQFVSSCSEPVQKALQDDVVELIEPSVTSSLHHVQVIAQEGGKRGNRIRRLGRLPLFQHKLGNHRHCHRADCAPLLQLAVQFAHQFAELAARPSILLRRKSKNSHSLIPVEAHKNYRQGLNSHGAQNEKSLVCIVQIDQSQ